MISTVLAATMIAAAHIVSNQPATHTAPAVLSTVPTMNAIVEPGPIALSVTFDRPMRRQSYSFVQKSAETYPQCGRNQPVQSADGRTFTLQCHLQAKHRYEISFNSPPYMNFVDSNGVSAIPLKLRFRTK